MKTYGEQDDSEVLGSDFPDLRTSAVSVTSAASTSSVASITFTASFHQKNYCVITCKGHDTVVSLSAGDDTRPAEA